MIELIKLEKKDLDEFTDIAINSFTDDKNTYGDYPPLIDINKRKLRFIDKGYTYKIVNNNKIIGGAVIFGNKNCIYTLGAIFIDPTFQNQGIGQQVISMIEDKFPDAKKWNLDTPYLSFRNHHFYEKMGYIKVGEVIPDKNKDFKLFLYEKTIK